MKNANEELARSDMEVALRGDFEGMLAHYTAVVMHVRDGKISEIWPNIDDPYAVDTLLV